MVQEEEEEEEEEEETQSPSGVHLLANPMVPACPDQLALVGGVTLTTGLPGSASWLRLSSSSPPHVLLIHTTPQPRVARPTQAALEGGRGRESGSTSTPAADPARPP